MKVFENPELKPLPKIAFDTFNHLCSKASEHFMSDKDPILSKLQSDLEKYRKVLTCLEKEQMRCTRSKRRLSRETASQINYYRKLIWQIQQTINELSEC